VRREVDGAITLTLPRPEQLHLASAHLHDALTVA
jgi:hypothetical protein